MSKIIESFQTHFSVENYSLHVTNLRVSSNMQSMLIGCYCNLFSIANDESSPNQAGAFIEIIKQYYAIINVPKIEELNDQIKELQTQIEKLNIEIANLKENT